MKLSDMLLMSLGSLFKRKARTILTILGVIVGTVSIVVMISLGIGMAIRNLQISELDARHGVTVGSTVCIERGYPAGIAEDGFNTVLILDTGADVGGIPDAVLLGRGKIILEETETAGLENGEGHDECEGFF